MGIIIEWDDDEKTILRQVYNGLWTWQEMDAMLSQAYQLIEVVGHRVDFIVDIRKSNFVPDNFVSGIGKAERKLHPNQGVVVLVGATALIDRLLKLANDLNKIQQDPGMVSSLEEARAFIAAHRPVETPAAE